MGLRVGMLAGFAGLIALVALHPAAPTPPQAEPADAPASAAVATDETAAAPSTALPESCDELAAVATAGGDDAVLLGFLCPETPLPPLAARAFLLAVADPVEAAYAQSRLSAHPGLAALAGLVSGVRTDTPADGAPIPRPEQANVSPVDAAVVGHAQEARDLLYAKGIAHEQRTRARAYLAKVVLQALKQLGAARGQALAPFPQLLATLGMHHGRVMANAHWRRRVPGLAPVFSQVEDGLLDTLVALQTTPHFGEAARGTIERGRVREYVQRSGPAARIDARRTKDSAGSANRLTTAAVWTLLPEIERLAWHGLVDRGVQHIVAAARSPEGPGLVTLERVLTDALHRADRAELVPRVARRLRLVREKLPQTGPGTVVPNNAGPSRTEELAADATAWLVASAHAEPPFARIYAAARAVLVLRRRPDALAAVIESARAPAADAAARTRGDAVRAALPLLLALLDARGNPSAHTLRIRSAAEAADPARQAMHEAEARRRRRFAVALR